MSYLMEHIHAELNFLYDKAKTISGCRKVQVGAGIYNDYGICFSCGANKTLPLNCKVHGCRRVELYGEDSKNHRNPEDCRAIHAEIDAITALIRTLSNGAININEKSRLTMIITRYPCETCARAIANTTKIKRVIYAGEQEISMETRAILESYHIEIIHIVDWKPDFDTSR